MFGTGKPRDPRQGKPTDWKQKIRNPEMGVATKNGSMDQANIRGRVEIGIAQKSENTKNWLCRCPIFCLAEIISSDFTIFCGPGKVQSMCAMQSHVCETE